MFSDLFRKFDILSFNLSPRDRTTVNLDIILALKKPIKQNNKTQEETISAFFSHPEIIDLLKKYQKWASLDNKKLVDLTKLHVQGNDHSFNLLNIILLPTNML